MDNGFDSKPPYGGFGTFWNFIGQLGEAGDLPQVLDRSVMGNRGGSARSDLYTALRFFGLIDDEKRPTDALRELAADPTKDNLRGLVETRFGPLIELGLGTATPTQVGEALTTMGATPSTVARSRTFFLNACEEAGIEIGKTLKTARAPSTTGRRRPRAKKQTDEPETQGTAPTLPPLIGALVAKLPAEADGWNESDAKQWLSLVAPSIAYDYKLDLAQLVPGGP